MIRKGRGLHVPYVSSDNIPRNSSRDFIIPDWRGFLSPSCLSGGTGMSRLSGNGSRTP